MTPLQTAVLAQLGYDEVDEDCKTTLSDIANYGVDGGFHGFIYNVETVKFFDDNRKLIFSELEEMAEQLGESGIYMLVRTFKCMEGLTMPEIMEAMHIPDAENETQVKNCLAWFAAEEVARQLTDE